MSGYLKRVKMANFALITGCSRGLGAYLSRRFWQAGYSLILVSKRQLDIQDVINDFPAGDDQVVIPMVCDLSDCVSVSCLLEEIQRTIPHLHVIVNNAAIQGPIGPLCENDSFAWRQTLQVNLLTPVALCKGLIPLMRKSGRGCIINMSGGGAAAPRPNFSAYAVSKCGLVRFSETIAEELKNDGIRVNCIAPGAMKTAMLEEVINNRDAAGVREAFLADEVFISGGASMSRVADLALFLACDASANITGKLISAVWDDWEHWPEHIVELSQSDVYTLRRIAGRDRGCDWGDI